MKKLLLVIALVLSSAGAQAACDKFYPNNTKPEIENTVELCNSFYVVLYDHVRRGPVIASEVVQPRYARLPRESSFRTDKRVGKAGTSPRDYLHSGYDQGHMVPSGDAMTPEEMYDTFVMTNMTPQEATLNRKSWRLLEADVRTRTVKSKKPATVMTIALYSDAPITIGRNKAPVPYGYIKIAYISTGPKAYYADNQPNEKVREIDVTTAEKYAVSQPPKEKP